MMSRRPARPAAMLVLATTVCVTSAWAQDHVGPVVPEQVTLSESARQALEATYLTDVERRAMRVFHGVWDARDLDTATARAQVALNAWDFLHPALSEADVPVEIRAEALLRAGEMDSALALLEGATSNRAARIRAEALEALGRLEEADRAVDAPVRSLMRRTTDDAAALTEGVKALVVRSRLQGQPARDFQTMMNLLARARQELDRLYWPARLAEAELLLAKSNEEEAIGALHETLSLNPRCAAAWHALGRIALNRFDFDSVHLAADALERIHPRHPLAELLLSEARLVQDDPDGALEILRPLLRRWPKLRDARALVAAAQAIRYDEPALRAALAECDALSPGSAKAYYVVGRHLSFNRQYEAAAQMLEEAIERQPAWPPPQIELGLMELQSGRDDRALRALRRVTALDPFDKRAANSLFLLEQLAEYQTVESEHFIVRFKPGIDRVMVDMMLEPLERIHETVSTRFEFEPDRKTVIELMPDHKKFAVRITGMPWIHTIAACTGPVIAMEVPREGPRTRHLGPFDWPRVLQHEYTHTITLAQTKNRIPHWLTEAAAVSMEPGPPTYETCLMLARSFREGTLFDLDEIKWAFVRPERPGDRAKAYAQGHWMVQFMNERFGSSALVRLLGRYFHGEREAQAIPAVLGVSRDEFFRDFLQWAGQQVRQWGLAPEPSLTALQDELRAADPKLAGMMRASRQARLDVIVHNLTSRIGQPRRRRSTELTADHWPELVRPPVSISDEVLADWLAQFPDHPDLLELALRRRLAAAEAAGALDESLVPDLERYARARPVDPFPHKQLARIWLASDMPERAIGHLEALDLREEKTPVYALELARLYRGAGRLDDALAKVTRALHINPYLATSRERAAEIAIEAGRLDLARLHIEALTRIEPGRPQHQKRLEAITRLMDRP